MHGSKEMTSELINGIANGLGHVSGANNFDVLVCPSSVYLSIASGLVSETSVKLGAQNVNANEQGAFTGEISLPMLAEIGCQYVLLGHSERRELFGETNGQVAEKFSACVALDFTVTPVLCIGETLEQRQQERTNAVLSEQLDAVLEVTGIAGFAKAVIAYEPVWAIGTGETATPEQAQNAHEFIRNKLAEHDQDIAQQTRILYGGSMKPTNALELLSQADIDGGLIGGASLQAESFLGICKAAAQIGIA